MEYEFTAEEIEQVVRTARIFNPGFTKEEFHAMVELKKRLQESGFLESVRGLNMLEEERDVSCTQSLEAYAELEGEIAELREKTTKLEAMLQDVKGKIADAQAEHTRWKGGIEQAKRELAGVKAQREGEELQLAALVRKAEGQKQQISREIEKSRQAADITKEEIAACKELKSLLETSGLNVALALTVLREFTGHENAVGLVKTLEERGTLTRSNAALIEENERLKSERVSIQGEIVRGQMDCKQLELMSSHLKASIAHDGKILKLYHCYLPLEPFIEYLRRWDGVSFHHCWGCGARFLTAPGPAELRGAPTLSRASSGKFSCPRCGLMSIEPDQETYRTLNAPVGIAGKLL